MEQVKVFYDRTGNTLTVWFGYPEDEYICEEIGDEIILMKNRKGQVIGFDKLNFSVSAPEKLGVAFETVEMRYPRVAPGRLYKTRQAGAQDNLYQC